MKIGEPVEEDVIASHVVTSWFECGSICLENQECTAFSHLDEHSDHRINCKLARNTEDIVVVKRDGTWTTYGIRSNGLVRLTIRIFLNLSYPSHIPDIVAQPVQRPKSERLTSVNTWNTSCLCIN